MATKMQLLSVLAIAVMATHLVSPVSSSRLLRSNSAVAAEATSAGDHDSLPNVQKFQHVIDLQQLSESTTSSVPETTTSYDYGNHKVSPAKTTPSSDDTSTTESTESGTSTAPYFPDYETHDNSPGFNG